MIYFEDILLNLKQFWKKNGCSLLEGYDFEVGAATLNPMTALNAVLFEKYNICQVQYCRRPADGRFAQNPNRLSSYYQMQIIMKPFPKNIQELCIDSIKSIGFDIKNAEIKFLEDNWKNPSIGASGVGYEMWYNGMEVLQFTYMQKIGGIELKTIPCELTYGLERLAMYIQGVDNIFDIQWNKDLKYSDLHAIKNEQDNCFYYQEFQNDNDFIFSSFEQYLKNAQELIEKQSFFSAYSMCLKASHTLNILDARNLLSQNARQEFILRIRTNVQKVIEGCVNYVE